GLAEYGRLADDGEIRWRNDHLRPAQGHPGHIVRGRIVIAKHGHAIRSWGRRRAKKAVAQIRDQSVAARHRREVVRQPTVRVRLRPMAVDADHREDRLARHLLVDMARGVGTGWTLQPRMGIGGIRSELLGDAWPLSLPWISRPVAARLLVPQ